METIYFKGEPCHTYGSLPKVGEKAPCFTLVTPELKEVHCTDFKGRKVVLNIFPSLDTPVCATSVRRFNQEAASLGSTPADGAAASAFRSPSFIEQYGVGIVDGPLAGLLARAVIVIDEDQNVVYADLVNEITNEPNYAEALDVLRR